MSPFFRERRSPSHSSDAPSTTEGLIYADADFDATAALAVDYLVGLGHSTIAFVNGPERLLAAKYGATLRVEQGVLSAAAAAGVRATAFPCEHSVTAGREALAAILKAEPNVTAIVTMNEEATVGLVQAAQARGLDIPRDFSVLSLASSSSFADVTWPPLTTISPPAEAIGRAAARELIRALGDATVEPEARLWSRRARRASEHRPRSTRPTHVGTPRGRRAQSAGR